ncbi:MAG: hypothetical protein CL910_18020 [Deltaproteobacteria bacterium]|nr:hypothetical protein [Deltaproteobacteria bacterium]
MTVQPRGSPRPGDPGEDTSLRVREALAGDAASTDWVVTRYTPLLLTQARYRLKGALRRLYDPQDLVSEVWVRALPRLAGLDARGGRYSLALLAYLSTLLRNRAKDLLSRHIAGKPVQLEAADATDADIFRGLREETSGVVTRAVRQEDKSNILQCLDGLPAEDRELIVLRGIEQIRNRDVATILGEKPNTVAVRYKRALHRLRDLLPGSIFEEFSDSGEEDAAAGD